MCINMIELNEYLHNPCGTSSIPYWKSQSITVPSDMKILHADDLHPSEWLDYSDEPYFRLSHNLKKLSAPVLGEGYLLCDASLADFAAHINFCYDAIDVNESQLQKYILRPVYDAALWIAVRERQTGEIVATGIGELDREVGEGVLEWIQVSEGYRGRGLGSFVVMELLRRMQGRARFATVSGQCNNPSNPEGLYRKCGFTGNDVWHILRRKE